MNSSCDSCGNKYDRCPDVLSGKCVSYQGAPIPCLNLCTGDSISYIQEQVALKLCELVGLTDMSTVVIPPCLVNAWGTNDPTILNLIQLLLNESCALQAEIDSINTEISTIDPLITVEWKCCSTAPCYVNPTIKVSEAIQSIIDCICRLNGEVAALSNTVAIQGDQIVTLQGNIASINTTISAMISNIASIRSCTGC